MKDTQIVLEMSVFMQFVSCQAFLGVPVTFSVIMVMIGGYLTIISNKYSRKRQRCVLVILFKSFW